MATSPVANVTRITQNYYDNHTEGTTFSYNTTTLGPKIIHGENFPLLETGVAFVIGFMIGILFILLLYGCCLLKKRRKNKFLLPNREDVDVAAVEADKPAKNRSSRISWHGKGLRLPVFKVLNKDLDPPKPAKNKDCYDTVCRSSKADLIEESPKEKKKPKQAMVPPMVRSNTSPAPHKKADQTGSGNVVEVHINQESTPKVSTLQTGLPTFSAFKPKPDRERMELPTEQGMPDISMEKSDIFINTNILNVNLNQTENSIDIPGPSVVYKTSPASPRPPVPKSPKPKNKPCKAVPKPLGLKHNTAPASPRMNPAALKTALKPPKTSSSFSKGSTNTPQTPSLNDIKSKLKKTPNHSNMKHKDETSSISPVNSPPYLFSFSNSSTTHAADGSVDSGPTNEDLPPPPSALFDEDPSTDNMYYDYTVPRGQGHSPSHSVSSRSHINDDPGVENFTKQAALNKTLSQSKSNVKHSVSEQNKLEEDENYLDMSRQNNNDEDDESDDGKDYVEMDEETIYQNLAAEFLPENSHQTAQ